MRSAGNQADSCVLVIFGATGDLTRRKLLPALYYLARDKFLPDKFGIVAVGRQEMLTAAFRKEARGHLKQYVEEKLDAETVGWLEERIAYVGGDFHGDKALFGDLSKQLDAKCSELNIPRNFLFYLALPPQLFSTVPRKLDEAGLCAETDGWRRFVFEKPFGRDLASARKLNRDLITILREEQIYRIDHYLGKETVQNILTFRFGNSIFEPIWNRNLVDHVQITVAEKLGVEQRGEYYDSAGALRDMIPNHILQLVTLTAMEPPVSFEADAVRDEQVKVLDAIKPFSKRDIDKLTARGQYAAGTIDGKKVDAYLKEPKVKSRSRTETFAALKLSIENWRWAGVPFYVRTGKRMPDRHSAIVIQFKAAPFTLFSGTSIERLTTNRLVIHIQPDEGLTLHFGAKIPGPIVRTGAVDMDFDYVDFFGEQTSTGYERLLYDAMTGDATLFQRSDMVEASWRIVSPILKAWQAGSPAKYAAGTWGPKAADEMLERDGRKWNNVKTGK
jgi:glucose-6-phosphate 1-dehydrogenase